MFHRVLPDDQRNEYDWNKGLAITADGLRKWVEYFRIKGYDIIALDEVDKRLKQKKSKKFVAFTFDDGYKDNLTYGLPVLEELKVPATIYVANCFPNYKTIYWWYFLEDFIKSNTSINLNSIGINYKADYTIEKASSVYNEVRELLRVSTYETHVSFAKDICKIENLDNLNYHLNLSWEEVIKLNSNDLITIGGHTNNHVSLKNQNEKVIENEVLESKKELEDKLGTKINHFAYPYGSLDDADSSMFPVLSKAGYKTSVLNHTGSIFDYNSTNKFAIPRMGLSDDTPLERVENLLNGKAHLDFNGAKKGVL